MTSCTIERDCYSNRESWTVQLLQKSVSGIAISACISAHSGHFEEIL